MFDSRSVKSHLVVLNSVKVSFLKTVNRRQAHFQDGVQRVVFKEAQCSFGPQPSINVYFTGTIQWFDAVMELHTRLLWDDIKSIDKSLFQAGGIFYQFLRRRQIKIGRRGIGIFKNVRNRNHWKIPLHKKVLLPGELLTFQTENKVKGIDNISNRLHSTFRKQKRIGDHPSKLLGWN